MGRPSTQNLLRGLTLFALGAGAGVLSAKADTLGYTGGGNGYVGDIVNIFVGINPEKGTVDGLLPGLLFGVCVALVYRWCQRGIQTGDTKSIPLIICYCSLGFLIARFLTALLALLNAFHQHAGRQDGLVLWGLLIGIPGFLGTLVMMLGLNSVTHAYPPQSRRNISILGGLAAALLLLLVSSPTAFKGLGEAICFFSGWQSLMLVAVGLPLFSRSSNHAHTPPRGAR
jgi:hypothetical protein